MDRLCDRINDMPKLPIECERGYLGSSESLVIYPLPGSRVIRGYMDGTKDWQMNYEIAMKSDMPSKIHQTLWTIQNELEGLSELESQDNSFEFDELFITNKPFINQADDQGWFVFLLNVQAKITILKGDD